MTSEEYLAQLRQRLAASFELAAPPAGAVDAPLYARSRLVAGRYILHKAITYERVELNEHVLCRVMASPVTPEGVQDFVQQLKDLIGELVKPHDDHMSTAITGVLIGESGFAPGAGEMVARSGFTRNFWFGLRGWCFLRLLGVDLATGQTWANRRGKEVLKAYKPS